MTPSWAEDTKRIKDMEDMLIMCKLKGLTMKARLLTANIHAAKLLRENKRNAEVCYD